MPTIQLNIQGMHCSACVRRVRAALAAVPGATVREVVIGRAEVDVADEHDRTAVEKAVSTAGFAIASPPP